MHVDSVLAMLNQILAYTVGVFLLRDHFKAVDAILHTLRDGVHLHRAFPAVLTFQHSKPHLKPSTEVHMPMRLYIEAMDQPTILYTVYIPW